MSYDNRKLTIFNLFILTTKSSVNTELRYLKENRVYNILFTAENDFRFQSHKAARALGVLQPYMRYGFSQVGLCKIF